MFCVSGDQCIERNAFSEDDKIYLDILAAADQPYVTSYMWKATYIGRWLMYKLIFKNKFLSLVVPGASYIL